MKKILLLLAIFLFNFNLLRAQSTNEFDKLKKLYVAHKYETCLSKSEKYIKNSKTKNEPIPYLYYSKSCYELSQSQDPEITDYYKNALKDALKYAIKFMQKDKDGLYTKMAEDYIPKLTNTFIAETKEIYKNAAYSKASSNYKQLLRIIDDDNVRFAKGVCDALNNNHSEARSEISTVLENYKYDKAAFYVDGSEQILIGYALDYTDYLLRNEEVDSALSTIDIIMQYRPLNSSLVLQKEKIKNSVPVIKTEDE